MRSIATSPAFTANNLWWHFPRHPRQRSSSKVPMSASTREKSSRNRRLVVVRCELRASWSGRRFLVRGGNVFGILLRENFTRTAGLVAVFGVDRNQDANAQHLAFVAFRFVLRNAQADQP